MSFLDLAKSRSCCRGFTPKPVLTAHLNLLLEAAQSAPSAGNIQPWHFYVVTGQQQIRSMVPAVYSPAWFATAQAVIIVCADAEESAKRYGKRGSELYCIQDTAAAVQNILLCAQDLGLGACWVGAFEEETCARMFSLPAHHRPVALIPLGYPEAKTPKRPRKPINEIATFL